jgi:hypothetical protein
MVAWLPPLIRLDEFGGDWKRYEAAVYEAFCRDFVKSQMTFKGLPLHLKRHPLLDGKEATFWHFTSEGSQETERVPDLRRCERICWPRQMIIRAGVDPAIKVWENERPGGRRACLWLEEEDYLVVLALRDGYVLPWTAYLVLQEHRKRKLRQEYIALKVQEP